MLHLGLLVHAYTIGMLKAAVVKITLCVVQSGVVFTYLRLRKVNYTNRPSTAVSRHITVDLNLTLVEVHSVDAI